MQTTAGKAEFSVSIVATQPVTYSWESIEVYSETRQGNCFKRQPTAQKQILDNGRIYILHTRFPVISLTETYSDVLLIYESIIQ